MRKTGGKYSLLFLFLPKSSITIHNKGCPSTLEQPFSVSHLIIKRVFYLTTTFTPFTT